MRLLIAILFLSCFSLKAQQTWDLQRCIDYALEHNLSVKQAQLNVERAAVNYDQSKWALLPNLNAQASHGYNWGQRIDPFTNQFATDRVQSNNFFLSSSLDLFNGFNKINTVKGNHESLQVSNYDLDKIKNDISLQLCLAYLQVIQNRETVAINRLQVAFSEETVERTRLLVEGGQLARGSLFDAESQLAQEELNLINAENAVVLSLLNLTQLLQLPPNEAQEFDIVAPDLSDVGANMLEATSLDIYLKAKQNMPEIMAADKRRTAAEYNLSSSRGLLYPSLSLSGSVGTGYSGANYILTGSELDVKPFGDQLNDNLNQNLQLSLSIPILNGKSARANVQRAAINRQDAEIAYDQVSQQLRFEVEQAYNDAKAALNRYVASQRAVAALEESFKYAEVRLEQNVINNLDFNNIKTQYTNAQSTLINSRYDFVFRTKILDFYMGNPITL